MARKRDLSTEKDDQEGEEQKVMATMVRLTLANKKYLFVRKAEGKGSLSEQVNRLIEVARMAGWE